jgi:ABC-type uncharacterized transport system fused permease/ATPase subunit
MRVNGVGGHGATDEEQQQQQHEQAEPLLSAAAPRDGGAAPAFASAPSNNDNDPLAPRQLLPRLTLLARSARAAQGAACLALLSVAEAYVVSRSGAVSGEFYRSFVDRDAALLGQAAAAASCWYGLAALLAASKQALADALAWAWRARLARRLQRLYLSGAAHYRLAMAASAVVAAAGGAGGGAEEEEEQGEGGGGGGKAAAAPPPPLASSSCTTPSFALLAQLDSPDQRLAQDLPGLTRAMADAAAVVAAAPFGVAWYSVLVWRAFGGTAWPCLAAALFFAAGAAAQRALVLRVARRVVALEQAEGRYRFAHARLRGMAGTAEGVALYSSCSQAASASGRVGAKRRRQRAAARRASLLPPPPPPLPPPPPPPLPAAELAALDGQLRAVLRAEGRLIPARWALAAATRLVDYGGALLNYACIAAAVFGVFAGAAFSGGGGGGGEQGGGKDSGGGAEPPSAGDVAQRVSVASFYLLTLIYSFTQVLDLSRTASDVAGLAARVGGLYEGLLLLQERGSGWEQRRRRQDEEEGEEEDEEEGEDDDDGDGEEQRRPRRPAAPLLSLRYVSLSTPGGSPVVRGLSLELLPPSLSSSSSSSPSSRTTTTTLLVVGPSGCGKTTLVRALAGLAPVDAGEVSVVGLDPHDGSSGGVFFVPQRPLAAPGATLRQQLCYPGAASASASPPPPPPSGTRGPRRGRRRGLDEGGTAARGRHSLGGRDLVLRLLGLGWQQEQEQEEEEEEEEEGEGSGNGGGGCGDNNSAALLALLDEVGLAYLPARLRLASLDTPLAAGCDWASVLSPGELQRLAFARVLQARPVMVVLDEATAALGGSDARALYAALQRRGIAYVTCGHHEAASAGHGGGVLGELHEATLRILGDGLGGWVLEKKN